MSKESMVVETEEGTVKILLKNSVKCLVCGTVLDSNYRHDYKMCGCENKTFVDGGLSYQRTCGVDLDLIEDLSVRKEISKEEYQKLVDKRNEDMYVGILKYYSALEVKEK